jgi:hypothetical protein
VERLLFSVNRLILKFYDVDGVVTLGAGCDFKFHFLAFVEGLEAIALDGRVVDEYVAAALALDETIALGCIEPLYFSFDLRHLPYLLLLLLVSVKERFEHVNPLAADRRASKITLPYTSLPTR